MGVFFLRGRSRRRNFLKWFTALQAIMLSYMTQITRQVTYLCDGSNLPKTKTFSAKGTHTVIFCLEIHVLPLQRVKKNWNNFSNIIKKICVTPEKCFICWVHHTSITKICKNTIAIYLYRIYVETIEEHCIGVAVWWASFGIKTCDVISHAGSVLAATRWLMQPAWSFEHLSAL